MILTAKFEDANCVKKVTPRGRVYYDYEYKEVVDTLNPVTPKGYSGKTFYVRGIDMGKDHTVSLYDADGKVVMGSWRHGRYGSKVHTEPLEYWQKSNRLCEVSSYASGQIKDQHKYLLGVL